MPIDHVLYAVRDFREAAEWFRSEHGLVAVEGGRHTGWGTANWIVPLGSGYIEVVGVVDPELAATTLFGRRALDAITAGGGLFAWCVTPHDFWGTLRRLGLAAAPGSRQRPDGAVVAWQAAGLEIGLSDPSRPFFLAWEISSELHPGRAAVRHDVAPRGIAWVEVSGDETRIREWLGDDDLPVRVRSGEPALLGVGIATDEGQVVIR